MLWLILLATAPIWTRVFRRKAVPSEASKTVSRNQTGPRWAENSVWPEVFNDTEMEDDL